MANKEKYKKSQREYLTNQRMQDATLGQPPNTVKRLLKRYPSESPEDAINRAQMLSWWSYVVNPTPRSNSVAWWVWFCDEKVEALFAPARAE